MRPTRPARFGIPVALLLAAVGSTACGSGSTGGDDIGADAYVERLTAPAVTDRFVEATGLFLGTPYHNGPLGEGEHGGPDPDPRVDFARADCVTYLEQSLALALVHEGGDYLAILDAIRYRDAQVDFAARNHYMVADWIPANDWLLEDVTKACAPGLSRAIRRTIDRARFLEEQGAEPRPGLDGSSEIEIDVIPNELVDRVDAAIVPGDLIFWVGKREGIFVVHTGLAVRDEGGALLFRHASSKAGGALDESFADYAVGATFAEGFLVLRLKERPLVPDRAGAG
jgi:hypothetical protein